MKFVLGGILHESNTFCPRKTPLDYFDVTKGDDVIKEHTGSRWFLGGVIDAARELGVDLHPTIAAMANPYGVVDGDAYDHLTSELHERIGRAGAFDGVVLCLHGGMVAEGSLDPEGEILQVVRETVGHETPIVCTLDMHCNVSERMVESADALFANNENPHLDSYDRGVEATKALHRIVRGRSNPSWR